MKRLIFTLFALLAIGSATAQPPMGPPPGMFPGHGEPREKKTPVERIAHIVAALELTPEQAEKFAPVFLNYQKEVRNIKKELKMLMDSYKDQEIDDKAAFRMVMAQLNADADVIACKKEYIRVFKSYLTPEQLSKVFLVEKMRPRHHKGGDGAPQGMPPGFPPGGPEGVPPTAPPGM